MNKALPLLFLGVNNLRRFIIKYSAMGDKLWTWQPGSSSAGYAHGVAVDGSGIVYVTKETHGSLDGYSNASSASVNRRNHCDQDGPGRMLRCTTPSRLHAVVG